MKLLLLLAAKPLIALFAGTFAFVSPARTDLNEPRAVIGGGVGAAIGEREEARGIIGGDAELKNPGAPQPALPAPPVDDDQAEAPGEPDQ